MKTAFLKASMLTVIVIISLVMGWVIGRDSVYRHLTAHRCYYTFFSDGKGKSVSHMHYLDEEDKELKDDKRAPGEIP